MSNQGTRDIDQLMAQVRDEVGNMDGHPDPVGDKPSTGGVPLGEVMRRVRAEVARRRGATTAAEDKAGKEDGPFPHWRPVAEAPAIKDAYALGELLIQSDIDFVRTAYQIVLRRSPDKMGEKHYLGQLRAGRASKVDVIGDLRFSPEGRARGVHVDGLLIPYTFSKWKRKRFIGRGIRWLHAFVRLGTLTDRQAGQIAGQAHEVQALGATVNQLSDALARWQDALHEQINAHPSIEAFEALKQELEKFEQRLQDSLARANSEAEHHAREALAQALDALGAVTDRMGVAERAQRETNARLQELADRLITSEAKRVAGEKEALSVQQRVGHVERVVADHKHLLKPEVISDELRSLSESLLDTKLSLEKRLANLQGGTVEDVPPALGNLDLDPLYAAFEDRFRGDRMLVRRRAEPYLDIVREVGAGTPEAPVLDIGCGRGEWLELLREQGLVARGIDLNRVFADICRGYGLDVMEGDAIRILSTLPSASIGAITSMHLVEHLSFEQVIVLLDEAHRVLRPGAAIILETPNPENPSVGSHTFYMDPTHRNPLPPEALRWIVEARGFQAARVERLTVARELNAPALVPDDLPGAASINAMLSALNIAPDYAIVARKP